MVISLRFYNPPLLHGISTPEAEMTSYKVQGIDYTDIIPLYVLKNRQFTRASYRLLLSELVVLYIRCALGENVAA